MTGWEQTMTQITTNPNSNEKDSKLARRYWCFISYRHTDNTEEGRQWASWLHQQLETYEVPDDLVGTDNDLGEETPTRIYPVFRDEAELSASSDLEAPIKKALENSKVLIVLCSPRVLESTYVAEEIRYYKQLGRSKNIYAVIIEGEPGATLIEGSKCFPDILHYEVGSDGELNKSVTVKPLAADFRLTDGKQGWTTPEAYRQRLLRESKLTHSQIKTVVKEYSEKVETAKLKLISGILSIPFGQLQERDKAYQLAIAQKRAKVRGQLIFVFLVISAIAAVFGWLQNVNYKKAESQRLVYQSQQLSNQSKEHSNLSAVLANQTYPTEESESHLLKLQFENQNINTILHHAAKSVQTTTFCPCGDFIVVVDSSGVIHYWDISKHQKTIVSNNGNKKRALPTFNKDGSRLAFIDNNNQIAVWNRITKSIEISPDTKLMGEVQQFEWVGDKIILRESIEYEFIKLLKKKGKKYDFVDLQILSEENAIVTLNSSGDLEYWNSKTGKLLETTYSTGRTGKHEFYIHEATKKLFLREVPDYEGMTYIYNLDQAGDLSKPEELITKALYSLDSLFTISPDGLKVADNGYGDKEVRLVELDDLSSAITLSGHFGLEHIGDIWNIEFNQDGTLLASSGLDSRVIIWQISAKPKNIVHEVAFTEAIQEQNEAIHEYVLDSKNNLLFTVGPGSHVDIWKINPLKHIDKIPLPSGGGAISIAMNKKTGLIAVGTGENEIFLFHKDRLADGPYKTIPTHTTTKSMFTSADGDVNDDITALEINSTGNLLAAKYRNGPLIIWDLDTLTTVHGTPIDIGESGGGGFCSVKSFFGSRKDLFAYSNSSNETHIWDITGDSHIDSSFPEGDGVIAWNSACSQIAVTNSSSHTLAIWAINPEEKIWETEQPYKGGSINVIKISPDEKYVAAGDTDGLLYIWSRDSGRIVGTPFKIYTGVINFLNFEITDDNKKLIVASHLRDVVTMDLSIPSLTRMACQTVGQSFEELSLQSRRKQPDLLDACKDFYPRFP